ncbi:hypothetical protein EZV62_006265 [Acer yangbiense]|uniref:Uncharacterized protein n=1 Tax=Acer yangbiense TaxID=1000413 RepID=A0A5C7IPZ5_9ROSI|nr:hypothetical protein EZV62_006265 [Acer yangbiense]
MRTFSIYRCSMVVLRSPSQHPTSSVSAICSVCSLGVLMTPPENNFIFGHCFTTTFCRDGNSIVQLPE